MKKVPIIYQLSDTECGIASLAMIFSYYNVNIPLETLREDCGVSRDGCKASTLINVANKYCFNADAYKVELDELKDITLPVIAFWSFSHYVVINKVKKDKILINDPAHGLISVTMDEIDKAFTGVIIDIKPGVNVIKINKMFSLYSIIKAWISGFRVELTYIFICSCTIGLIPYLNSITSSIFVDRCIVSKDIDLIIYILFISVISAIILISVTAIKKFTQFRLYSKASILKSSEIIFHVLQLPLLFYSLRQRSEIISIISRSETVINIFFKNLLDCMVWTIALSMCLLFMINTSISLSLISIVIIVIYSIIFFYTSSINLSYDSKNINISGKLYSYLIAIIKNIETVKSCALESHILKKWHQLFNNKVIVRDKLNSLDIITRVTGKSYHTISMLLILCFGENKVSSGVMSVGDLMSYYTLHLIFYSSFMYFLQSVKEFQTACTMNMRIQDIMVYEKDNRYLPQSSFDNNHIASLDAIQLKNVSFYYNENSLPVLNNISIRIEKGNHVAFVGGSGSGKSTILKLLCGLYQPTSGEINYFSRKLSNYSAAGLASMCAYVSQDISLFEGTIYQNIVLWNNTIDITRVENAIFNACLTELIDERDLHGYVEENGRNFSGGERQRIDIARALTQNTPILILDEATSALDNDTESNLIRNLRNMNKTVIYVAHRLSSIQHCDQIFVMRDGAIVEYGTHSNLLNNMGYYSELVEKEQIQHK